MPKTYNAGWENALTVVQDMQDYVCNIAAWLHPTNGGRT